MKRILLIIAATVMAVNFPLFADDKAAAVDLVKKGLDFIAKNGEEKAFKEFTNKKGAFTKGELYIFVVDFKGMTLAHGGNEALVGKSMYDLKDSDGKYFIRNFIEIAQKKGEGWSNYKWSNPSTKKIEDKSTFVKRAPKKEYFLGCGIYVKK